MYFASNAPGRHIPLDGTSNFRDLGGYRSHDGRSVRWGQLFRSDHLAHLSAQGLQQLQSLGVAHSIDFRGQQERQVQAYAWPALQTQALSVEPTVVQEALALVQAGGKLGEAESVAIMQATYRSFVRDYAPQFAQLFQSLLQTSTPLVFHCTAGKDRTGWAAALILEALGVDRPTIARDYLLTNQYYQRPHLGFGRMAEIPEAVLQVLWRVQPEFLESAYAEVHTHWGDMSTYLQDAMGLDADALQRLRQRYLVAAPGEAA